jgi:hypothetical protein
MSRANWAISTPEAIQPPQQDRHLVQLVKMRLAAAGGGTYALRRSPDGSGMRPRFDDGRRARSARCYGFAGITGSSMKLAAPGAW